MPKHLFGRRPDRPDARDKRFGAENPRAARIAVPQSTDLRSRMPETWDQGEFQSCGPTSASAFLHALYPRVPAFSRMQIYYDVRTIEKTGSEDIGVEVRSLFKVMQITGAATEKKWPYDKDHFAPEPDDPVYDDASAYTIGSYSRLVAESSFLRCLAMGLPFVLGFMVLDSFDTNQLADSGVMPMPKSADRELSGHAVLAVGYDLNFKKSKALKDSGLDPALVSDRALLLRNSWGTDWGCDRGHFWMPLDYATNPRTGGDAWTGKL